MATQTSDCQAAQYALTMLLENIMAFLNSHGVHHDTDKCFELV